jgi:hypothetical protein
VTSKLRIGYVGVGLMGLPMVKRLVSLQYAVRAYDVLAGKTAAAAAAGAQAAASPADAAQGADLVLLNLPTTDAVEQAVFGEAGVASALRPPQLLIDFSTIKVDKCRAFAQKLRAASGCGWIDAPVSGGPPASGSGTLTTLFDARAVQVAQPSVTKVGGITEFRRVAALAAERKVRLAPHSPFFGPGALATLHLSATLAEQARFEYFYLRADAFLYGQALVPERGELPVPQGPGLGIDPDAEVIRRYRQD